MIDHGWDEVSLGDVADITFGFPFKSAEFATSPPGPRLLRGDNIGQGTLRWTNAKYWPEAESLAEAYQLAEGDVVLAMDRPWIEAGLKYAAVRQADLPSLLVQRVARLRPKPQVADGFLQLVLAAQGFTNYVLGVQTGTAVPHISGGQIRAYKFRLPPFDEQRRIAEVLGTIDDLIDTNERLKGGLDELARATFLRGWDGETWTSIGELGEITMGQSPPGDTYSESPVGMPFHQGVRDFGARFPRSRVYCEAPTRVAEAGDILIAVRAPVGEMNVALERLAIGRGLAALRPRRPAIALQALRAFESTWSAHQGTGTVFSSINGKDLRAAKVPSVEDDGVEALLAELDHAYSALDAECAGLRLTRDEILPLLLAGALLVRTEVSA